MRRLSCVLAGLVAASQGATFFAAPQGDDRNEGLEASPVQTLAACVGKLKGPGDECRLKAGRYAGGLALLSGVSGTADKRIVIAAAVGENPADVIIDGTEAFECDWKKGVDDGDNLWSCKTGPVRQLWVDNDVMQTPARWPDALWADRSIFNATHWAAFDEHKPWGPFPHNTPEPITFYDAGGLAKSGLDATGAVFIGVIAHDDTWAGVVTKHTPGSQAFDAQMHIDRMLNTKVGNSIYYLEGLKQFANQESEWAYSPKEGKLYLYAEHAPKNTRRKTDGVYALEVTESKFVTVANLTFFGTTLNAHDYIDSFELDSVVFNYPNFGYRSLLDPTPTTGTVLSMGKKVPGGEFIITNCTWFGGDGPTLKIIGNSVVMENNLFDSNAFSTHWNNQSSGIGGWVATQSANTGGRTVRNTFRTNGPGVCYESAHGGFNMLNLIENEADIVNDGASVQIRSGAAGNTSLINNWALRTAKGFRLDSGSNSAFVPDEVNNTIHGNIAFHGGGFELKNDYNSYVGNMAILGPQGIPPGRDDHTTNLMRVDTKRFKTENTHSIHEGNVATSWDPTTPGAGVQSKKHPNVYSADAASQLMDPENLDFRPVKGSAIDKAGAGPYTADSKSYWIPGRKSYTASTPIPPHQTSTARPDADLMFLGAYKCDTHSVHFAKLGQPLEKIAVFAGEENVVRLADVLQGSQLVAGASYTWRVDAVDPAGNIRTGPVWTFTVRE